MSSSEPAVNSAGRVQADGTQLRAILGVKKGGMMRVCSWCSDRVAAERWCRDRNLQMTHTICPTCFARYMSDEEAQTAAIDAVETTRRLP